MDNYVVAAPDGRTVYIPVGHMKAITTERNGERRYAWKTWGEIQVWNLESGKQEPSIGVSADRDVNHAVISPDGQALAAIHCVSTGDRKRGEDGYRYALALWDLKTQQSKELAPGFCPLAFSPDGRFLVASVPVPSKKYVLKLWDAHTGQLLSQLGEAAGSALGWPLYSPDGGIVAAIAEMSAQSEPRIRLWDVPGRKELNGFTIPAKGSLWYKLAFSPDGHFLAAAQPPAGRVFLLDVPGRKLARTFELKQRGLRGPVFSPDGRHLAIAALEIPEDLKGETDLNPADLPQPRIYLFDLVRGGDPEVLVCPHGLVGTLAFSPDSKTIALGGYGCVWLFQVGQSAARN